MSFFQINPTTLPTIFPPARFASISSIMEIIIPLITISASFILLVLFLIGAFKIITAGGDPEKIKSAQQLFSYAIVGFIIIILSYLLVRVLGFITGVAVPL